MSDSQISISRWKEAQKFERDEWVRSKHVVKAEWQECVNKFSKTFPQIAKEIKLKDKDKVLDVGCGPTVPSRLFKKGIITGLEPLARQLHIEGDNIVKGVKIVQGRGEDMPFASNSFRVVLCRNVIDHSQNPKKIISQIHRVLRAGGYLILVCYTYTPFITFIKNLSEKYHFFNNTGHPFTYTPTALENLVDGKFQIVKRYTFHTGKDSTDYGKKGVVLTDDSLIHTILIWANRYLARNNWFVKEYGFIAVKKTSRDKLSNI